MIIKENFLNVHYLWAEHFTTHSKKSQTPFKLAKTLIQMYWENKEVVQLQQFRKASKTSVNCVFLGCGEGPAAVH